MIAQNGITIPVIIRPRSKLSIIGMAGNFDSV